jgi:type II secretory pathway pseudopilin PulG
MVSRRIPIRMRGSAAAHRLGTQRGFSYLALLFIVALVGIALAITGEAWSRTKARQNQVQVAWEQKQVERAVRSYVCAAPGNLPTAPVSVEQLLLDDRYLGIKRHLRDRYPSAEREATLGRAGISTIALDCERR